MKPSLRFLVALIAPLCVAPAGADAATIPGTSLTPSVWLDASQLQLSDGASAHPWPDVSGNGRNATATNPARAPIYRSNVAGANGMPVVRFNSELQPEGIANQFLHFPGPLANSENDILSLYVVASDSGARSSAGGRATFVNTRTNGTIANGFLFGFGSTSSAQSYAHVGRRTESEGTIQATPVSSTGFNVLGLTRDGLVTTVFNYTDSDKATTTTTWTGFVPSTLTTTQIGTEGGMHYLFGDIAEIIAIEGVQPTAEEHLQIVRYLGEKYDITFAANATPDEEGYAAWAEQQFGEDAGNPAISGPDQDPDGDSLLNLLEYALGADPLIPDTDSLPAHGTFEAEGETYLTLTFSRPVGLTDLDYQVEVSSTLEGWSSDLVEETSSEVSEGRENVVFRDLVPVSNSERRFLRLRVSQQ